MLITFPVAFRVGSHAITAHFIFESLAYAAGFRLYLRHRRQQGDFLPSTNRFAVIAAALLGAALGSKLLFWLEDPALTLQHISDPAYLLGGKTVVGGLLGGTLAVEWIKRRLGIARRTGDLFALPITAAIAIGRIGCFLAGLPDHTYGAATSLPWGVDFGDGIPRHPTQLYEVIFLGFLALALRRPPRREGDRFRAFLLAYLAFRLCIDFIKPGVLFAGLTAIQWACALAILSYRRDIPFLLKPKGARPWVTASGLTSSTTPPSPSAPSASAAPMPKSSSRTETSIS